MAAHESDMVSSIKSLLHFCSSMSLATKEDDQSLFKTLICNTQYVDREKLFASMFGEESYVDWGALAAAHKRSEARKKGNPVGDATVWNNLLSFISGDRKALQKAQQQHVGSSSWLASMISGGSAGGGDSSSTSSSPPRVRYRSFYAVYDAIESTLGSKSGQNMGLDADAMLALSVRAFFILNLMGIVPITALEFMLSKVHVSLSLLYCCVPLGARERKRERDEPLKPIRLFFPSPSVSCLGCQATKKTVTQQAQTIMISVSSEKFTPLQYADTIAWLHSSGVVLVDTVAMRDEILHISTRNKTTEETMKVYSMQVAKQGRPSLMTIAMTASNGRNRKAAEMMRLDADGSSSSSSSSYDTYFAFQGFKYKMRFPTSLSIHMQQQAYWLVSQRDSFGWRTYATYFLDKDLSAKLVEYGDILSPDPSVIAEVLSNTSIVGPPFQVLLYAFLCVPCALNIRMWMFFSSLVNVTHT